MKICYLIEHFPYPPDNGRKNTIYSIVRLLAKEHGHEVVLICLPAGKEDRSKVPDYVANCYFLQRPSRVRKLYNLLVSSLLGRRRSLQNGLFHSPSIVRRVREIIAAENPDVLIGGMIRGSQLCEDIPIPKILDLDDCLSLRYRKMAEIDSFGTSFGDAHIGGRLGAWLFAWAKPLRRFVFALEGNLVERDECRLMEKFDATVVVNDEEASHLEHLTGRPVTTIRPGADLDRYGTFSLTDEREDYVVFHGVLAFHDNAVAVGQFLREVWPLVKERFGACRFLVIGRDAPAALIQSADESVEFLGYVDDIQPILRKAGVYAAWTWQGSGVRTKFLDAFSIGCPLVTTSFGASGSGVADGQQCLIRDDPAEFADAIVAVLRDKALAQRLAVAARSWVEENLSNRTAVNQWNDLITQVAAKQVAARDRASVSAQD